MSKTVAVILVCVLYFIIAVLAEAHGWITSPPGWATFGGVYGAVIATILGGDK